jgi:hypothetical protein
VCPGVGFGLVQSASSFFGGFSGGNDIFDAVEGAPGTTLDPFTLSWGFSSNLWSQAMNAQDAALLSDPEYLQMLANAKAGQLGRLTANLAALGYRSILDSNNPSLIGGHFNFVCTAGCPSQGRYDGGVHVETNDGTIIIHDDTVSPWTGPFSLSAFGNWSFYEHGAVDLFGGSVLHVVFPQ